MMMTCPRKNFIIRCIIIDDDDGVMTEGREAPNDADVLLLQY